MKTKRKEITILINICMETKLETKSKLNFSKCKYLRDLIKNINIYLNTILEKYFSKLVVTIFINGICFNKIQRI